MSRLPSLSPRTAPLGRSRWIAGFYVSQLCVCVCVRRGQEGTYIFIKDLSPVPAGQHTHTLTHAYGGVPRAKRRPLAGLGPGRVATWEGHFLVTDVILNNVSEVVCVGWGEGWGDGSEVVQTVHTAGLMTLL